MKSIERGYIQVYTGNGKGKTTAALGLALRAAGAGFNVFIGQFLKAKTSSEYKALSRFEDLITIKAYGRKGLLKEVSPIDIKLARDGLEDSKRAILSNKYKLVILDEASVAVHLNLFPIEALLEVVLIKPPPLELVITGRYAHRRLIEIADLVTEMKEIKHYYKKGIIGRRGIEY